MKWAADLALQIHGIYHDPSVACIRRLQKIPCFDLGLTPQALCLRLLRRLKRRFGACRISRWGNLERDAVTAHAVQGNTHRNIALQTGILR